MQNCLDIEICKVGEISFRLCFAWPLTDFTNPTYAIDGLWNSLKSNDIMSTVVLYCWCHSGGASVLLYFTLSLDLESGMSTCIPISLVYHTNWRITIISQDRSKSVFNVT